MNTSFVQNRRFLRAAATAVAALFVWIPPPATASELSQTAISEGLAAMKEGRVEAASVLFTRALEADPTDLDARYYRGLARVRLEQFTGAIDDLSVVADERPETDAVQMGLGFSHYSSGDYSSAEAHLARVPPDSPLAGKAKFYLAMTRLRAGEADAAAATFAEVEALDPSLALTARYYRGVASLRAGDTDAARASFVGVRDARGKPVLSRAAAEQLDAMEKTTRPYRIYGSLGLEYDSNVVLIADDGTLGDAELDAIGVSDEADGRTVLTVGAAYSPYRTNDLELSIGYDFAQSLHFDLTDFDLQSHRLSAGATYELKPITLGLLGTYDYYFRETKSFLGEAGLLPWLRADLERFGYTDLYYRLRERTYHGVHFGEKVGEFRDGMNHAAGIAHTLPLAAGQGYVVLGYRYDHDAADHSSGEAFDYDGHLLDFEIGWTLPADIALVAGYAYKYENYDDASDGREDDEHHVTVTFRKPLMEGLAVLAGYFGTINDSNEDIYQYERHIASLTLEASY